MLRKSLGNGARKMLDAFNRELAAICNIGLRGRRSKRQKKSADKLKSPKEVKKEVRKLTELDWLNILNHYKMLLDGFKRADWEDDNVREQVASTMIKKTKDFFEKNYPDLIEVKKRPIFDKDDFK